MLLLHAAFVADEVLGYMLAKGPARIYHGYVLGIISLQVIRDGTSQPVSIVPVRTGTAVKVLFCLPSSMETFIVLACVVTTGYVDFRKISY